jgi:hypothetical protein
MNYILLFAIGIASGVISGMGIGGGTLLIPALTLLIGLDQKTAQALNLMYFIPTAVAALISHIRNRNIEYKGLVILIIFGTIGSVIGCTLALATDTELLRMLFGAFLGVMGVCEIIKGIALRKKSKSISSSTH